MLIEMIINQKFKLESLPFVRSEGVVINFNHSQAFSFGEINMSELERRRPPLCKCGCGEPVKRDYWGTEWNKFIQGHQNRGKTNPMYGRTGEKCPAFGIKRYDIRGGKNPAKRPEVRKKISKNNARAMLNRTHTEKAKEEISKNHRDISGKNNPMYKKGHTVTGDKNVSKRQEVKAKISMTLREFYKDKPGTMYGKCGPLSPVWKGGIACEPYCDAWADQEYKESIKKRDGNVCMNPNCWMNCERLGIHHVDYNKKNCHPNNLITLCISCNSRANGNREVHTKFYQNIMTEQYGYIYAPTQSK